MITPEQLAKADTEHAHQSALFCWASIELLAGRLSDLEFMYAVPNGGERNVIVAGRMKAEGVKKGVPDICLPARRSPYPGIYIEMKRPRTEERASGRLSDDQKRWLGYLVNQGYYTYVCYSWKEAALVLTAYLDGRFEQSSQRKHTL